MTLRNLSILSVLAIGSLAHSAAIWREGEEPTSHRMNRHPWWYDKVKAGELSGGQWLSNFNDDKQGQASYDVTVDQEGKYAFWLRANPVRTKLSYQVDDGAWTEIDMSKAVDVVNVAEDGKPDLRFIGWVRVGDLALARGRHTVRFKTHSELHNHGAIDAFLLTTEPFAPQGARKPGELGKIQEVQEAGTWAWDPPEDAFSDKALLDLRGLNEKQAGQSGFVRLSADGSSFVKGDGTPIRFWATGSSGCNMSPEDMKRHARHLAKLGVNMVRLHVTFADTKEGSGITDLNEKLLDGVFRFVKECRDNGVYVTISPFYGHFKTPASWDVPGTAGKMPWGVIFIDPKLQTAYRHWTKELYTRTNPYTGRALRDEPAIAIIQVQNEDSTLFWTFQGLPPEQQQQVGKLFGQWLVGRYGSLDKAQAAWGGLTIKGDDFSQGVVALYITWEFTQDRTGRQARRLDDQLRFLGELQREFYRSMGEYFRKTLGCKQLVNASNWRTADQLKLDDVERWTYAALDVIAVNRYTGGVHEGANNGYRIDPGHRILSRSILKDPLQLPVNLKQVAGHPMIVTETTWVNPNLYQSEGPFLISAYQSLGGVDAVFWFHAGEPTWMRDPRRMFWKVGTSYALEKWTNCLPTIMGMFPANALTYRLGYLRQGRTVVHEERKLEAMWQRKHPIISESEAFDPNRDARDLRGAGGADASSVSRLAFLVGPVEAVYGGDPAGTAAADLSSFVDPARKTIRSNTGELTWEYGTGVCRVNAPKAQGVAGFLKDAGGSFELADVTIRCNNEYAAVSVVAMDDQPLKNSAKVLVQVGTTARLTGWQTRPVSFTRQNQSVLGEEIVNTGKPPYRVAETKVALALRNGKLSKATLLDGAGYAAKPVELKKTAQGVGLALPANAMWVVLE